MKSNESFWLFIHPYVFVSHESRALRCMLYNTQSGERVETSDLQAMEIVKQMHKKTSLGTFLLHADQFPQDTLHFINECIEKAIQANAESFRFAPTKTSNHATNHYFMRNPRPYYGHSRSPKGRCLVSSAKGTVSALGTLLRRPQ